MLKERRFGTVQRGAIQDTSQIMETCCISQFGLTHFNQGGKMKKIFCIQNTFLGYVFCFFHHIRYDGVECVCH